MAASDAFFGCSASTGEESDPTPPLMSRPQNLVALARRVRCDGPPKRLPLLKRRTAVAGSMRTLHRSSTSAAAGDGMTLRRVDQPRSTTGLVTHEDAPLRCGRETSICAKRTHEEKSFLLVHTQGSSKSSQVKSTFDRLPVIGWVCCLCSDLT